MSTLLFERVRGKAKRKHFRRVAFKLDRPASPVRPKSVSLAAIMPSSGGVTLKAIGFGIIRHSELVAMHKIIRRKLDRRGSLFIYTLPFVSLTSKPLAVRMGKGKGAISTWVIPCAPGKLIFRVYGVPEAVGRGALLAAARKLNFETLVTTYVTKTKKPKVRAQLRKQLFKYLALRATNSAKASLTRRFRSLRFAAFTFLKRAKADGIHISKYK